FCRQKSARWSGWCKSLKLLISNDTLTVLLIIDQLTQRQSHRYFINSRAFNISRNRKITATFPAVHTLISVVFAAAKHDEWRPGEGFDIADQGWQILQPIRF